MFKNKVGRPTNNELKIKKVLYAIILLLTGIILFNCTILCKNYIDFTSLKGEISNSSEKLLIKKSVSRKEAVIQIKNTKSIYAVSYKLRRYFLNGSSKIEKKASLKSNKNKTNFLLSLKKLSSDNTYDIIVTYSNDRTEVLKFTTEPDYYIMYFKNSKTATGSMSYTRINETESFSLKENKFYNNGYKFKGWKAERKSDGYIYGLKKNAKASITNKVGWYKNPGKVIYIKDKSKYEYSNDFIGINCKSSIEGACETIYMYAQWEK